LITDFGINRIALNQLVHPRNPELMGDISKEKVIEQNL